MEGDGTQPMDKERERAEQFLGRLLANPAIDGFGPLSKEEQIHQFFQVNGAQLYPTLSSPAFFPGKDWPAVQAILARALTAITDGELEKGLTEMFSRVDYGFLSFLAEGGFQAARTADTLLDLQKKLLKNGEARKALNGPFAAVAYAVPDLYLEEAFRRREYIHFELVKVQKLRMSKEEIKALVQVSVLLRNTVHFLSGAQPFAGEPSGVVQPDYAHKVTDALSRQSRALPPALLSSAVNSNVSFIEDPAVETTARLTSIFAHRCNNYRPIGKVDRGADTPDKSWFNIARRNYKYYGFDIKMLDELYKIAGENGW